MGAALTVGLVRPWGKVWPSWVPRLGGRRVPPLIALVPASFVGLLLAQYGAMTTLHVLRLTLQLAEPYQDETPRWLARNWALTATYPVFLVWGVALLIATAGYWSTLRQPPARPPLHRAGQAPGPGPASVDSVGERARGA